MDPINWNDLLGSVVKEAGPIVAASIDKPLTNAQAEQPVNQTKPAAASAQAAAAAKSADGTNNISKYMPFIIGGGVLVVGAFFFLALRSAK